MNEFAVVAQLGILIARPATLVAAAPAFGGHFAPAPVRIGLSLLLAVLMAPLVPPMAFTSTIGLGVLVAREMAIGLIMAMAVRAVIAGAELGGHLAGNQLMLSYGSVIDPQGGVRNNLVATLYGNLTLLTFLAINGHHAMLRALMQSYVVLPIGSGGVAPSLASSVTQLLGIVFVLGLRLAAPIIVVMLVLEVGMALMARVAPSLNLMAVAPPVRVMVGLLAVAAMIPLLPSIAARASAGIAQVALQAAAAFR